MGGHGANIAIMTAKMSESHNVYFVGCVGDDFHGKTMIENFKRLHLRSVDSLVRKLPRINSGMASIEVVKNQLPRRIIVPGANDKLTTDMIDSVCCAMHFLIFFSVLTICKIHASHGA